MTNSTNAADAAASAHQRTQLRTHVSVRLDLYTDFAQIQKIQHNNNEENMNNTQESDLDRVFFLGLKEWKKEAMGYEIIHAGKTADGRILKKLGNIAYELLQVNTYPQFPADAITSLLNQSLGHVDKRTFKEYRKTLLYYANIDEEIIEKCDDSRFGKIDVSGFVRRIPNQYVRGHYP